MEKGSESVYPSEKLVDGGHPMLGEVRVKTKGITKREYFAAMAMQGCLAKIVQGYGKPNVNQESMENTLKLEQEFIDDVAIKSVRYSDALLAALEKIK